MLLPLLLLKFIVVTSEDSAEGNIATLSGIQFPGVFEIIINVWTAAVDLTEITGYKRRGMGEPVKQASTADSPVAGQFVRFRVSAPAWGEGPAGSGTPLLRRWLGLTPAAEDTGLMCGRWQWREEQRSTEGAAKSHREGKCPDGLGLRVSILSQLEDTRLHLTNLTSCSCQLKTMRMCFEFSRQGCITS